MVQDLTWSGDGRLIATTSSDKTIHEWDASTGESKRHSLLTIPNRMKRPRNAFWSEGSFLAGEDHGEPVRTRGATQFFPYR